jgi:hypothetical protein
MRFVGRSILSFVRSYHYWHKHHLKVSLALLVLAAVAFAAQRAGLVRIEYSRLPLVAEHAVGTLTALLFGAHLLLASVGHFVARYYPPAVVPTLTRMPTPISKSDSHWLFGDAEGEQYRFRIATSEDVPSFVSLAMADPAIVTTYSYLSVDQWGALYQRWHDARASTLMVLERSPASGAPWGIVGVSSALPLSHSCARALWTGAIGTVDIAAEHLSAPNKRPFALLLDLIAADRTGKGVPPDLMFGLPKIHLSRHHDFGRRGKMEIWVEPVHRALPPLLLASGFEGPHSTAKEHTFYRLCLPLSRAHFTNRQLETARRFREALIEAHDWPVQSLPQLERMRR